MLLISKLDLPLAPNWIPNPSSVDTSPTFSAGPAPAVPHSPPPVRVGVPRLQPQTLRTRGNVDAQHLLAPGMLARPATVQRDDLFGEDEVRGG